MGGVRDRIRALIAPTHTPHPVAAHIQQRWYHPSVESSQTIRLAAANELPAVQCAVRTLHSREGDDGGSLLVQPHPRVARSVLVRGGHYSRPRHRARTEHAKVAVQGEELAEQSGHLGTHLDGALLEVKGLWERRANMRAGRVKQQG